MPRRNVSLPLKAVAYFVADAEVTSAEPWPGVGPGEWFSEMKVLQSGWDPNGSRRAVVSVVHPDWPKVVFTIELAPTGDVLGVGQRPLLARVERTPTSPPRVVTDVDGETLSDGPGLNPRTLRTAPWGELIEAARAEWRRRWRWLGRGSEHGHGSLEGSAKARRRPNPARNDSYYAQLAAKIVAHVEAGGTMHDLAGVMSLSVSVLGDRKAEAQRRGLLVERGRGRAGGRLTARARSLLER